MGAQRIPHGWANRRLLRAARHRANMRQLFGVCTNEFATEHPCLYAKLTDAARRMWDAERRRE